MRATTTACDEFTRSSLLRSGLAVAGAGLPTIEPGMPDPAGTGLTRRSMLLRSTGLAMTVFGAAALGPRAFDAGIADAAASTPDSPILVSIYLTGGLDGLSLLAPVDDPLYRSLRPAVKVASSGDARDRFSEDDRLQWHPKAKPLQTLHREGKLTVIPAVGYTDANQSHFTSRHFWEVGQLDTHASAGWLGRYLDIAGTTENPMQGLSLDPFLSPALAPRHAPVSSIPDVTNVRFWANSVRQGPATEAMGDALRRMGEATTDEPERLKAQLAARNLVDVERSLRPLRDTRLPWQSAVTYPVTGVSFPTRLAVLAEMIGRGLPLRCVTLQPEGGYDTHADQPSILNDQLGQLCPTLYAFQRDLEARGVADRVITHVWSEFGRRVRDNGSGTDHGAGGVSLLMGSRVKGTMVGEFPGLSRLDHNGDLLSTTDYRSVYSSLLEQWLGADAGPIIPGADRLARPALIA